MCDNNLNIIALSDVHFKNLETFPTDAEKSKYILYWEKIDLFVYCGDLCRNGNGNNSAVEKFFKKIIEFISVDKIFIIFGNNDSDIQVNMNPNKLSLDAQGGNNPTNSY